MVDRNKAYDARRRAESPTRALYGTQRWRRRAAHQLLIEPLCRTCQAGGRVTAAKVADHIIPHRGDVDAFWNNDLQSLCATCHDVVKQREEKRGHSDTLDADGWPADPRHPANESRAWGAKQHPGRAHPDPTGGGQISGRIASATGGPQACAEPRNGSRGSE